MPPKKAPTPPPPPAAAEPPEESDAAQDEEKPAGEEGAPASAVPPAWQAAQKHDFKGLVELVKKEAAVLRVFEPESHISLLEWAVAESPFEMGIVETFLLAGRRDCFVFDAEQLATWDKWVAERANLARPEGAAEAEESAKTAAPPKEKSPEEVIEAFVKTAVPPPEEGTPPQQAAIEKAYLVRRIVSLGLYRGSRNEKGERHGHGSALHPPNGDLYCGQYFNGKRHGRGLYCYAGGASGVAVSSFYLGEFRDNIPEGIGMTHFSNGIRYEGSWKKGLPDGEGVSSFPNGDVYSGKFAKGKRNGNGKYLFSSGESVEGTWSDDVPVGGSWHMTGEGGVYHGLYQKTDEAALPSVSVRAQGEGSFELPSGLILQGTYTDGQFAVAEVSETQKESTSWLTEGIDA